MTSAPGDPAPKTVCVARSQSGQAWQEPAAVRKAGKVGLGGTSDAAVAAGRRGISG